MLAICSTNILCFSLIYHSLGIHALDVATTIPPKLDDILKKTNITNVRSLLNNSRRIITGVETQDTRPYMVYLKLPTNSGKSKDFHRWLCGGVIIHEEYILTSAACIEEAKHFYIVAGTHTYDMDADRFNSPCIKNGAKKAVWKCVPRNYVFDGHENDNIRWMNNDIAVVQVEDEFDFTRRIRGCDFIPRPICYNNRSSKLEEYEGHVTLAGWGSTFGYNENLDKTRPLLEAATEILPKNLCKRRWGKRYHSIIDNYMICTKDYTQPLSEICAEKYVDCTDIHYDDYEYDEKRKRAYDPETMIVHSGYHNETRRYLPLGGFCENDHGGPLVYGSGHESIVIGVISACLVKEGNNKCYGPYLYTSVYKNRYLINCAVFKTHLPGECNKMFRAGGTHVEVTMSWADHPDGPAKNEIAATTKVTVDSTTDVEETPTPPADTTQTTETVQPALRRQFDKSPLIEALTSTTIKPDGDTSPSS